MTKSLWTPAHHIQIHHVSPLLQDFHSPGKAFNPILRNPRMLSEEVTHVIRHADQMSSVGLWSGFHYNLGKLSFHEKKKIRVLSSSAGKFQ